VCSHKSWELEKHLSKSEELTIKEKQSSSILFTQLYFKQMLCEAIISSDDDDIKIDFPKWSSKETRKIGSNTVVKEAVDRIRPYIANSLFVGVIPSNKKDISNYFTKIPSNNNALKDHLTELGFLPWKIIENYCDVNQLLKTHYLFKFNKGQIFK
jgi:hypothetical protein